MHIVGYGWTGYLTWSVLTGSCVGHLCCCKQYPPHWQHVSNGSCNTCFLSLQAQHIHQIIPPPEIDTRDKDCFTMAWLQWQRLYSTRLSSTDQKHWQLRNTRVCRACISKNTLLSKKLRYIRQTSIVDRLWKMRTMCFSFVTSWIKL